MVSDEAIGDLAPSVFDKIILIAYFVGEMFFGFFYEFENCRALCLREPVLPEYLSVGSLGIVAVLPEEGIAAYVFEVGANILFGMSGDHDDIGHRDELSEKRLMLRRDVRLAARQRIVQIEK